MKDPKDRRTEEKKVRFSENENAKVMAVKAHTDFCPAERARELLMKEVNRLYYGLGLDNKSSAA